MIVESASVLSNPQDNTYPEGANAYLAVMAARTGQIYRSFWLPPNVLQAYGPLFYVTNMEIARASRMDLDIFTRRARLLSFICYVASGFLVFCILRKLGFSNIKSLLPALFLLAQPVFFTWDATVRPDLPALFLALLCLFLALGEEQYAGIACLAAGLAGGTAFLWKPSAGATLAAIAIAFLLQKKRREIFVFGAGAAIPLVVVSTSCCYIGKCSWNS